MNTAFPTAVGDYVMAAGTTAAQHPIWVPLTGSYAATGAWTIGALDLIAGSTNWRVRTWYEINAGDAIGCYTGLIGANLTGTYLLNSTVVAVVITTVSPARLSEPAMRPRASSSMTSTRC